MHKTYQALVKGDWQNDRQHAKFPLFKYVTPSGERRVRVDPENGLPSHSIFRLKERFGPVSLVEVDLLTGRTHQIRVPSKSKTAIFRACILLFPDLVGLRTELFILSLSLL